MLDTLRGLSGKEFDSRYHSQQVSAHNDAVSLFQSFAKCGNNSALKDWAGKTEPALEPHLQRAQGKTC